MKQIKPGHKRQHGAHYLTLSEYEVVELHIPDSATVNPNIGGQRALIFAHQLRTRGGQGTHDLKFTCFGEDVKPGDRVFAKLKLGNRQVKGNRKMTMYARLDVAEVDPTVEMTIYDDQNEFLKALGSPLAQGYRFPRESQPGGVVLQPLQRELPHE